MNKDYAEIETSTGNVMAIINSHAKPIPPTGRKMIEYDSTKVDPITKKWSGSTWVDIPKPPKPFMPVKLNELDYTKPLSDNGKDVIRKKIAQDMISRGVD